MSKHEVSFRFCKIVSGVEISTLLSKTAPKLFSLFILSLVERRTGNINGGGTFFCECTKNKGFRNLAAGAGGTAGAGSYPDVHIT